MNSFISIFKQGKGVNTPSEAAYAASIIMLTELVKEQEQVNRQGAQTQIAQRLKRIGMKNAYVTREQRMRSENTARLAFMLDMWRDLGTHAILVSEEHFKDILRRHDLMCGALGDYYGDVPTDNVVDIECAQLQSEEPRLDRYFNLAEYPTQSYYSDYDEFVDIQRAPFLFYGSRRETSKYQTTFYDKEDMRLFIAAPKDFIGKYPITIEATATKEVRDIIHKAERNGYVGRIREIIPQQLPYNYDPFICSLCDYGVIIHSMWGAEAHDATIKRYEQLRDSIISKAVPMMLNGKTPLLTE